MENEYYRKLNERKQRREFENLSVSELPAKIVG